MKYLTSGDIHRMFKQEDEGTIIRRNNVRRIALENGIKHTLTQNIILIDSKDFFDKVNPYNLQEHEYKIPKLRNIKDCAREWNKHRKKGDRFIHADEIRDFLKTDTTVFKYKFGNKWIVNYDQLLPHLKKINRRESKMWKKYMQCLGIKKSATPRKK